MFKKSNLYFATILLFVSTFILSICISTITFADDGGEAGGGQDSDGGETSGWKCEYEDSRKCGCDPQYNTDYIVSPNCGNFGAGMVWQYIKLDDVASNKYGASVSYTPSTDTLTLSGYTSSPWPKAGITTTVQGCEKMGGVYRYGLVAVREATINGVKFKAKDVVGTMAFGYIRNKKNYLPTELGGVGGYLRDLDADKDHQGLSSTLDKLVEAYRQALSKKGTDKDNAASASLRAQVERNGEDWGGDYWSGMPLSWFCWYPPEADCTPGQIYDSENKTCIDDPSSSDPTPTPTEDLCGNWQSSTRANSSSSTLGTSSVIAAAKNNTSNIYGLGVASFDWATAIGNYGTHGSNDTIYAKPGDVISFQNCYYGGEQMVANTSATSYDSGSSDCNPGDTRSPMKSIYDFNRHGFEVTSENFGEDNDEEYYFNKSNYGAGSFGSHRDTNKYTINPFDVLDDNMVHETNETIGITYARTYSQTHSGWVCSWDHAPCEECPIEEGEEGEALYNGLRLAKIKKSSCSGDNTNNNTGIIAFSLGSLTETTDTELTYVSGSPDIRSHHSASCSSLDCECEGWRMCAR